MSASDTSDNIMGINMDGAVRDVPNKGETSGTIEEDNDVMQNLELLNKQSYTMSVVAPSVDMRAIGTTLLNMS